jgi:transposase
MSRYDLTDSEWRLIEPLLPNKPRGVPRVDDRRVLNGIRVATRYDKLADNFLAMIQLASMRLWLRDYESTT